MIGDLLRLFKRSTVLQAGGALGFGAKGGRPLKGPDPIFTVFQGLLTTRSAKDGYRRPMKKLLIVLLPSLLATGCAPALFTAAAMSAPAIPTIVTSVRPRPRRSDAGTTS